MENGTFLVTHFFHSLNANLWTKHKEMNNLTIFSWKSWYWWKHYSSCKAWSERRNGSSHRNHWSFFYWTPLLSCKKTVNKFYEQFCVIMQKFAVFNNWVCSLKLGLDWLRFGLTGKIVGGELKTKVSFLFVLDGFFVEKIWWNILSISARCWKFESGMDFTERTRHTSTSRARCLNIDWMLSKVQSPHSY